MKKLMLISLSSLCFLTQISAAKKAKNEVATPAPAPVEETAPVVTEECQMNLSLFSEAAKQKNYADALAPWQEVYNDCPSAHRAIYTYGEKILSWQIEQEKDAEKRKSLENELITMFDKQMKYFKNDAKYPEGKLLGKKAYYFILFNDDKKVEAYDWLKSSVSQMGKESEIAPLQQLIIVSFEKYKQNADFAESFINDYLQVSEILDENSRNSALKNQKTYADLKPVVDALFVQSGVADCETMDKIFASKVKENSTNVNYLNNVLSCYRRLRCSESPVFFAASESVHKIAPTAESANGCASMAYKAEKFDDAISYYEEAIRLTENALDKADYQYKIAQILFKLDRLQKSREYARQAIANNPNDGKPYLLIGSLYAKAKIYDDPKMQQTVYWAAVDKFEQAKRVDPDCAADANKLISTWKQYFPSREDIFFLKELELGKPFRVGGWIGETTICRE